MKILLTGACGHIGSYILENINKIKNIEEVILIDNFYSQRYLSLFNLNKKIKFIFYKIDLSRKKLNFLKKVNHVIHCASYTDAQNSFSIKKEMYRNNLSCMKNIINYCKKNKSNLLHISSTSVYGKQANIVDENNDDVLKPQSPYAEIKLIEENLLKKDTKKIKFMTFRFGTIAGVSKGMRFHTAINKFCLNASLNENIYVYKTAFNQYRPYLSLSDAFKVFKFCIENNMFYNDTYNVLSGNYTVKQIIKIISKYKKKINIKFVKAKIMNQLSYKVENKKLKKIGIKLNGSIEKDIKQTLELFSAIRN